jgi:hypothetical protein
MLTAKREQEHREHKFMAALKGIDLDKDAKDESQDAFDRAQRRAEARLRGITEDDVEKLADANVFGLEFEVEE